MFVSSSCSKWLLFGSVICLTCAFVIFGLHLVFQVYWICFSLSVIPLHIFGCIWYLFLNLSGDAINSCMHNKKAIACWKLRLISGPAMVCDLFWLAWGTKFVCCDFNRLFKQVRSFIFHWWLNIVTGIILDFISR